MLIIAIIRSLFCPTVLCKYDLRKYVNTFRVRNETSRISYVLNMWNVLLWNAPCLIPAASYLAREILFDRVYGEPDSDLSKVNWSDHLVRYFSLMHRYGIKTNILYLTFPCAEF